MDTIALILAIIGAINWGLVGFAKFDLVAWIFGGQTAIVSRIIYALVGLADMSISCRTHCICPPGTARKCTQRRQVPGSNAFVPAAAGLILAGEVVKDLTAWERPL